MAVLKPVSQQDIETVQQLANEIWHEHYSKIISREQIDYMLSIFHSTDRILSETAEGCIWRLLWEDSHPVGYLMLKPEATRMYLSKIYLKKEFRGKGLGKLMMDFIKAQVVNNKMSIIYLNVNKSNTDTIRFYENNGFMKTGEGVFDIGKGFVMDDYIYELRIV